MSTVTPGRDLLPIADRRTTTRVAVRLVAAHRWPLVGAIVSFLLVGASALVAPRMLGEIVDAVERGESSITRYVVAIAVAAVTGAVFNAVSVSLLARAGEPAVATLREEVLERALHLDGARIEAAGTGDLMSRVGDDARLVADSVDDFLPTLVNSVVLVGFTVIGLVALDWRLALAGLVAAPFYAAGLRWYLPRSAPRYREERIAQGERAQALLGALSGARTVRAFALEKGQLAQVDRASGRARDIAISVFHLLTRFFARNNRAELIGLASVLGVGFWLVRADLVTVGAVTAAALYFHRLFDPIGGLLMVLDQLQSAGASLSRLVGVAVLPPTAPGTPPTHRGPLVLHSVAHAYVSDRPVLHPTDLVVQPGERVALVGATGAGKTTLGRIAAGLLRPVSGTVSLAGTSYGELGVRAVRSRVALLSQEGHVFAASLRDNLSLARPDATDTSLWAALDRVGATAWAAALSDGLDTVLGEGGHRLTPARAQQVALARIDLADPWFVVLDEATAEAGSAGAHELEAAALAVTAGRGALVIAHRLTQSASADRVVVLDAGRVVEQGSHDELVSAGGRYAELWQAWSGA